MSRYFMIQSWVGSHENEPDYNGQQCGERNVRSSEVVPLYDQFGNANTAAFSDEAIAARSGKATQKKSIPLKNKVLPQLTRYTNLTEQMKEIVAQYNAKEIDINEYTMLMDITVAKRDRAKVLLDKAMSLKPLRNDEQIEQAPSHTFSPKAAAQPEFMQEKKGNSVKKACTSAVRDCIILLTGSATLLMGLKFLF